MISSSDIERLIAMKRLEIESEKSQLGLSPPLEKHTNINDKENAGPSDISTKQVKFSTKRALCNRNDSSKHQKLQTLDETCSHSDDYIAPDLDRYIRRYIGLPVMLKAGEYSPNNPLVRGERTTGDALLGLGEYERRRNTLRKIRQQQYREYLDQQAKKKQEAKEQAERERREREQREKEREERQKELAQERDRFSPERRRSLQVQYTPSVQTKDLHVQFGQPGSTFTTTSINKVDTGVQVDGFSRPLSVAVQTDDAELYQVSPAPAPRHVTQAERELSPRSVAPWPDRRRSHGDYDERACLLKKCNRDKLYSELRHSYMPSIFDAEAIKLRNLQSEKEAAERRQYYQQELKNQILEQQRIKEERKNREKMLEQAEMRRLEEQLRMLRAAQDNEGAKQRHLVHAMDEHTKAYCDKRAQLQKEIDMEEDRILRVSSQPDKYIPKRDIITSKSDNVPSKLPFYYTNVYERSNDINKPYSTTNTRDNSIFTSNYDVDSYLRKNLNFSKNKLDSVFDNDDLETVISDLKERRNSKRLQKPVADNDKDIRNDGFNEKAFMFVNERNRPSELREEQPSKKIVDVDTLPIPVLRHSPKLQDNDRDNSNMSDAMKKVDDKWQVPAVQKNILKALPNEEGKNISILTQLGSIRRQLQLEQLRLDQVLSKDDGK